MKIGQRSSNPSTTKLIQITLLVAVLVLGIWLGERGWWQIAQQRVQNPLNTLQALLATETLPILRIDMAFEDYNQILQQRATAVETGAFIGTEADFYPATITFEGAAVPVRLRLKEGLAQNLGEDEKWGLEVNVRDSGRVLDMTRFELIDPANNNWLNQYAFTLALQREGILTSRYEFVHLFLNGQDRGLYAVQERFSPALPLTQQRPEGVNVSFDNSLLWRSVQRFGGDAAAVYINPITTLSPTTLQHLEVSTFRDETIAADPLLAAQHDQAIALLRAWQGGEKTASATFDIAQYGKFLALSDLWGAVDGITLSNMRYYFDPTSGRLEPIAYNGNPLADPNARISLAATWGDIGLQAAYVQAAEQYASPSYLTALEADLASVLPPLAAALQQENTAVTLPWTQLAQRQRVLAQSLEPVQPLFAYLGSPEKMQEGIIEVHVANVTNLPVEVVGVEVGGVFLLMKEDWLPEGYEELVVEQDGRLYLRPNTAQTAVVNYVQLHIPLAALGETNFLQEPEIRIATQLIGRESQAPHFTTARAGILER